MHTAAPDRERYYSTFSEGPRDGYSWRERDDDYDNTITQLSVEHLVSTRWVQSGPLGSPNPILIFYLDGVFRAGWRQSGVAVSGRFEVTSASTVTLLRDSGAAEPPDGLIGDEYPLELRFEPDGAAFWYRDALTSRDGAVAWYAVGSEQEPGTTLTLDEQTVIRMEDPYIATQNVRFRTAPSTAAQTILINRVIEIPLNREVDYVPRGQQVVAFARTARPTPVEQWNAHWYYVGMPSYESLTLGWVYGEFVAPYDSSLSATYTEWRSASWNEIIDRSQQR